MGFGATTRPHPEGGDMWYIIIGNEILTLAEVIRENDRGKND